MRPKATSRRIALCLFPALLSAAAPNALDLLRRSEEAEFKNRAEAVSYLYSEDITHRFLVDGRVVDSTSQRFEVIFLGREPYFRLVARDGLPLDAQQSAAEDRRMQRVAADRAAGRIGGASPSERPRVTIPYEILPETHTPRLLGEDSIDGFGVWVLELLPKKGYGRDLRERETRALKIKLWLDKNSLLRVRQDAAVIRRAGRLERGARISSRFAPQPDGVWLVERILFTTPVGDGYGARQTEQIYSSYRKFRADSKVVTDRLP